MAQRSAWNLPPHAHRDTSAAQPGTHLSPRNRAIGTGPNGHRPYDEPTACIHDTLARPMQYHYSSDGPTSAVGRTNEERPGLPGALHHHHHTEETTMTRTDKADLATVLTEWLLGPDEGPEQDSCRRRLHGAGISPETLQMAADEIQASRSQRRARKAAVAAIRRAERWGEI